MEINQETVGYRSDGPDSSERMLVWLMLPMAILKGLTSYGFWPLSCSSSIGSHQNLEVLGNDFLNRFSQGSQF